MINTEYLSLTLAPGDTLPVAIAGSRFICRSSSARFFLNLDGGSDFPFEQGLRISTPDGRQWNKLIFKNPSATLPLTITGYVSDSYVEYSPPIEQINLAVAVAATTLKPSGVLSLASLATGTYAGTLNGKNRKQIVVTNLSATADLHIKDSAGVVGGIVFPRGSWTIETSDTVKIYNPSGLAVDYTVLEIFYT